VLALSARHLSRTADFNVYVANQYYQECLQHLIPALADDEMIDDDGLLAATVILRLLEEMDGTWVCEPKKPSRRGEEPTYGGCAHLLGSRALMHAHKKSCRTKLRVAASWAGYRQELFTSLLNQRPPHTSSAVCPEFVSFDEADDCTWAHRAVVHCLQVIGFAFGDGSSSKQRYHDLMETNQEWRARIPPSFDAFFTDDSDDDDDASRFPTIRLHADWHGTSPHRARLSSESYTRGVATDATTVMGFQYNTLAHFVLLTHDPGIPKIGLKHRMTSQGVDVGVGAPRSGQC
jgi:hypothetical protein